MNSFLSAVLWNWYLMWSCYYSSFFYLVPPYIFLPPSGVGVGLPPTLRITVLMTCRLWSVSIDGNVISQSRTLELIFKMFAFLGRHLPACSRSIDEDEIKGTGRVEMMSESIRRFPNVVAWIATFRRFTLPLAEDVTITNVIIKPQTGNGPGMRMRSCPVAMGWEFWWFLKKKLVEIRTWARPDQLGLRDVPRVCWVS